MPTFYELLAQKRELDERIELARETEVPKAIAKCRAIIEEYGLTAFDLGLIRTQELALVHPKRHERTFQPRAARKTVPPKYRNPETGQTWSGHGRPPAWLDGHRDEYVL